jgi:hypothetical protein
MLYRPQRSDWLHFITCRHLRLALGCPESCSQGIGEACGVAAALGRAAEIYFGIGGKFALLSLRAGANGRSTGGGGKDVILPRAGGFWEGYGLGPV